MHFRPQGLQRFLVLDPEVLLLVDDDQAQVLERHLLRQHRVRADDDFYVAFLQPFARFVSLCGGDKAGKTPHPHRPALEAVVECLEVLAREQSGRTHQGHLPPAHRHHERRA